MAGLTVKSVESAKAGRHADSRGLYLLVKPSGSRSWLLRVQASGKRRDIGLGAYPDVSLAAARSRATELRAIAKAGGDPIATRDKERAQAVTFKAAAEACHEARRSGWTTRHGDAFISTLRLHVFPRLGSLHVGSVDERDIVAVLSPLWTEKPAAARKMRQRIATVLDFAKGHGWRATGAPRDTIRPMLPKQAKAGNFAAMPYADLPGFIASVQDKPTTIGRLALIFTILTAARSGEVRSALWSHIDLEKKLWTRPAALMKMEQEHAVTLSPFALAILRQAARLRTSLHDGPVFPGSSGRTMSDMTLSKIMKDMSLPFVPHGFRASFRTWAAEKMPTTPDAVAEAALAHSVPDAVVRAYQRAKFLDMRRDLLDAWGAYCEGRSNILRLVSA